MASSRRAGACKKLGKSIIGGSLKDSNGRHEAHYYDGKIAAHEASE